jgi:penicillin amidase
VGRDSAAAALYEIWLGETTQEVIRRVSPKTLWPMLDYSWTPATLLRALNNPESFGLSESDRDQILKKSLTEATARLIRLQGTDPSKWAWGKLHVVRFRHPLDQAPESGASFDLGPLPRPGDEYTVNATGYYDDSLEQVSGASYREILDTSNWDQSLAVNTPGQSGEPQSKHYSDLLPVWDQGKYFPLSYTRDAVEKVVADRLTLQP